VTAARALLGHAVAAWIVFLSSNQSFGLECSLYATVMIRAVKLMVMGAKIEDHVVAF
jgi:hypothetical protein